MIIAGVTIRNSQVKSLNSRSPSKVQFRQVSQDGVNREVVTLSYTHKYNLALHSLSRSKYIELYNALLAKDQLDDGQIDISGTGEIRAGLVHYASDLDIPALVTFDFDITTINPQVFAEYNNMTIPLSVYVAV